MGISLMNIISLFAGVGLLLFGIHLMGEELEKAAGTRLKKLFEVVTRNRILAMLVGVLITALLQSSTAATVMVVSFVNANLLSLTQAIGVIMGANIGTTVTSLLLSFKINFGSILACAGFVLGMLPTKKVRWAPTVANIVMGMGILFIGMDMMSTAMAPLREWEGFRNIILAINHPLLCVLIGAVITMILHSSAASVGILQALAGEGLIPMQTAIFILFGQNIGTCVTAMVAAHGTGTAARRASVVHLLFNVLGTLVFVVLAWLLPFADWIAAAAPGNLRLQIAFTHIAFNVGTTILLLPAASLLEKIACLLVPDTESAPIDMRLVYFDERMMKTPPIAAAQLFREVQRMGDIARASFRDAMACFNTWDAETAERVNAREDVLDYLNKEITNRLVDVKGLVLNDKDTRMVGSLFHVVADLERVGDHAINILESAQQREEGEILFSEKVLGELNDLFGKVEAQLTQSLEILKSQKYSQETMDALEASEQAIDDETEALRAHHIQRLKQRKCSARNGALYLDMLTNLERIGDHAENIATSVKA